jgi:V/A-type H+-transporting ATPase subunit C
MLSRERIERMLDAASFGEAAKIAAECGYPDMSDFDVFEIEAALARQRAKIYEELSKQDGVRAVVDLFRMKYDFHNVKALVKAFAVGGSASGILSDCGRVSKGAIADAVHGEGGSELLEGIRQAVDMATSALARTANPQLSDIETDRIYFAGMLSHAEATKNTFITGYVKLMIDAANLRVYVRCKRTGRSEDFLKLSLLPGGNVPVEAITAAYAADKFAETVFTAEELVSAVQLAKSAIEGGAQTRFERECDNALSLYCANVKMISFGPEVVIAYLTELDWEITAIRMILAGKQSGIAPAAIKERLRENYV